LPVALVDFYREYLPAISRKTFGFGNPYGVCRVKNEYLDHSNIDTL